MHGLAHKEICHSKACFYVYKTSNVSVPNGYTKFNFDAELFDPLDDYDNSTNYRYTPSIPGRYFVACLMSPTTDSRFGASISKNGTYVAVGTKEDTGNGRMCFFLTTIVDMNGTTDYLEAGANNSGTTKTFYGGEDNNFFYGFRIGP